MYRKMPPKARPPKHLLGEPSLGPYIVVRQDTHNSVVLRDPQSDKLVDNGAYIPMEQILAAPKRNSIRFETGDGGRSIGQMVLGEGMKVPPLVKASGWKPSRRKGWNRLTKGQYVAYQESSSRELSIAYVLRNDTQAEIVEAQRCRTT